MFTRREFLITSAVVTAPLANPAHARAASRRFDAATRLRALEAGHARLGVCFLDTASGESTGHRLDEFFAMCSTFKLALVAACLRESDRGSLDLDEKLTYSEGDLLSWAPVTRKNLADGGAGAERWRCRKSSGQAPGWAGGRHREVPRHGRLGDPPRPL
jgi:beta-lactamase class A